MNEDNTADQWASELVQLGGVGSAMGALGMWTGAHHEDDDPLGQYLSNDNPFVHVSYAVCRSYLAMACWLNE